MIEDNTEYRTMEMKSFGGVMLLSLGGLLSAFSIFMILLVMNIWVTLIFILPSFSLLFIIVIIRASKVKFGTDFVETSTLFGKKRIFIKDVNKFGVFFSGRYTWPKVTSQKSIDDSDDNELFGHKIYLTTNNDFDLDSLRPMKHILFPYRKEFYFKVKDMMERRRT
jgi:membrane protein implicated in regulation of membrane protease activity